MKKTLFCLIFVLLCFGCELAPKPLTSRTITNVVRVIEHDVNNKYTVEYEKTDNPELFRETFNCVDYCSGGIIVIKDVQSEDAQYVWVEYYNNNRYWIKKLLIHIYASENLSPGGWNHGKFGHGTAHEIK